MSTSVDRASRARELSLYQLLDPEVLANPYPLFHRLQSEEPVHWDPFLHTWVVTRYTDVLEVLHSFSAERTHTPERLNAMGLSSLTPIAQLMVRQMLFMDPPQHTRLRKLASHAFTPARVAVLRTHIRQIVGRLLDTVEGQRRMDVIEDLAEPLPAIVTAEMLGVPVKDWVQLKAWTADFAEMLGNFQHNPDRAPRMLRTVQDMTAYFHESIRRQRTQPREGLIHWPWFLPRRFNHRIASSSSRHCRADTVFVARIRVVAFARAMARGRPGSSPPRRAAPRLRPAVPEAVHGLALVRAQGPLASAQLDPCASPSTYPARSSAGQPSFSSTCLRCPRSLGCTATVSGSSRAPTSGAPSWSAGPPRAPDVGGVQDQAVGRVLLQPQPAEPVHRLGDVDQQRVRHGVAAVVSSASTTCSASCPAARAFHRPSGVSR